MIDVAPLPLAISAHRAAWDAYQIAPEGEDAELACCEMCDALDALVVAACTFPLLAPALPDGARELLAHLRWWLAEEAEFAADYQPDYAILAGRAADLAHLLEPAVGSPDPIVEAIVAVDMASAAHTATLVHRNEDDEASEAVVSAAGYAVDAAFEAVQAQMPTTPAGLYALAKFYERDAKIYDRMSSGGDYLGHVAAAIRACDSTGGFRASDRPIAKPVQHLARVIPNCPGAPAALPGQPEVEAAWRGLPSALQERIGVAVVDMVFQAFVHGDAYVATRCPKDRAVPGRGKRAQAIRDAAGEAETARLNELHRVVEGALPDLFGPAGQNPAWAVAMGARP